MLASFLFLLAAAEPLTTVANVDLTKYVGTWYEAARTPNRFQKKCASNVKVEYALQTDGKVAVLNSCLQANGKVYTAKGTAKATSSTAKLKVTFFWPFAGNYWVLDLDPNYRWAIVGEPNRKYLWFLTRDKQASEELIKQLTASAAAKGYDVSKLVRTKQ